MSDFNCGHPHPEPRRVMCDDAGCDSPARYTITAAYFAPEPLQAHPRWATYPAPMRRTCGACLVAFIDRDQSLSGATPGYLVRHIQEAVPGE